MAGLAVPRRTILRLTGYSLLAVNAAIILAIWVSTSWGLMGQGIPSALLSLARLMGLLAAGGALLQFILMGRAVWVEQAFGLERLAKLHRYNGFFTIGAILLHAGLVLIAYAQLTGVSLPAQYISFLTQFEDVSKASIATFLFLAVVGSSIYIVRRHLPYERWYWVHLMVYAAILLAFGHQVHVGGSFLTEPAFTLYWYALYAFVGLNVLIGRFLLPAYRFWRHDFSLESIVSETGDTVSLYIKGRHLDEFKALPGQFIIIWIPIRGFWMEEHPFSISALPADGRLRITPKNSGDYTAKLPHLKPGTPIVVQGPYGSFTPAEAGQPKRLYLAGGVGITPIRTMLEAQDDGLDSVLLYGNQTPEGVIFRDEITALQKHKKLTVHDVFSAKSGGAGEQGYIDTARIARLVPDFRGRDVYLCGPPAMMNTLIPGLIEAGLPPAQLHYERFALHPIS